MADEERHQAIRALKQDYDDKQSKLRQVEQQRRAVESTLRRAAFTAAQLDEMPGDVRTYRSVGKAYFLQPKSAIMGHLEGVVNSSDAELKKLSSNKEQLGKAAEGLRGELNELIQQLRRG